MSKRPDSPTDKSKREDRLKAALRANLNRRKAQDRARAADPDWRSDESGEGQAAHLDDESTAPPKQET
ncbi:hypothetical protein [Paracoccus aminophilus]|uniref:hypothetical protein n=1 Tax=Paracoccus aminophilus TaxID=34003 RepID=UPI000408A629|nr:hypothetical protein [Paracoccus aminophilus]